MSLSAIVVIADDRAIGKDNGLLCHLPADLKHFKTITMGHTIIMGRRTFESLPKGALPGRENIVVSRQPDYHAEGAKVCASIEQAIAKRQKRQRQKKPQTAKTAAKKRTSFAR